MAIAEEYTGVMPDDVSEESSNGMKILVMVCGGAVTSDDAFCRSRHLLHAQIARASFYASLVM